MTRETKIGLLVGLGFIVVFAVLLSHTGSVPPPGDSLTPSLVQSTPANKSVLSGEIRGDIAQPEIAAPAQPRPVGSSPESEPLESYLEDRIVRSEDLPDLPAPAILNPGMSVASADSMRGDTDIGSPLPFVGVHRTAPELPQPEPTPHIAPPTQSDPPAPSVTAIASKDTGTGKVAPPPGAPREYEVQSGDSLVRIAQKHYQSSDKRLVDFLAKSNEGRIKDADTIRQGQKLLIPDLPPEMFERVHVRLAGQPVSMEQFMNDQRKVTAAGSSQKDTAATSASTAKTAETSKRSAETAAAKKTAAAKAEESIPRLSLSGLVPVRPSTDAETKSAKSTDKENEKPSKSASSAKSSDNKKADKGDKDDQLYRWYEIKPNDTLGSISRRELGSSQYWQEIKKLNANIDPQKMKPGDKIKLPRKPISSSSGKGRPSA